MEEPRTSSPRKSSIRPKSVVIDPAAIPEAEKPVEKAADIKNVSAIPEIPPIDIYKDPLYNEDGTRNTNIPFCLFVSRKMQEERKNKKRVVSVSSPSCKERFLYQKAMKQVKAEKRAKLREHREQLKRMEKAKIKNEPKFAIQPASKLKSRDGHGDGASCPIACVNPTLRKASRSPSRNSNPKEKKEKEQKEIADKLKAIKKARLKKQLVKYPPVKTKPWKPQTINAAAIELKKKVRPIIEIPPFKTKKWVPEPRVKPKEKVVIEYPPVTRKPWKPITKPIKKPQPRIRLDKVFYPFPSSTLGKRWNKFKCLSRYQILRGHTSEYSKKFSYVTNGKQSAFIAAVALSFAKFLSMPNWKSEHIDEIILYGDINCRRQIRRLKHQNIFKPCDLHSKIYLKRAKVLAEFCEKVEKGCYEPTEMKEIQSKIENVLNEFSSIFVTYCGQTYAIWSEENAFYILNPEDTDEDGKLVQKTCGASCVIRSHNLGTIIDYLVSNFKVTKQRYEICSFRIDKIIKIEEELAKLCPQKAKPVKSPNEFPQDVKIEESQKIELPERPKTGLAAILYRHRPEPIFSASFQRSSIPNHGFLTCEKYLHQYDENRAPFIASVAILMLRVCKSSLWQSSTLIKIFEIGEELFAENVEKYFKKIEERKMQMEKALEPDPLPPKDPSAIEEEEDDQDSDGDEFNVANIRAKRKARKTKEKAQKIEKKEFPITEFDKLIVQFGNLKLEMSVESVIIGKVLTRKSEELSLKVGLENLFKKFDVGLILGPDNVAVWREQNYFFMYDPNHCGNYERLDEFTEGGNSCLSWFKNLTDLVELYVNNVQKEKRNFVYKICKVEAKEFLDKAYNWQNFKAINSTKWILSGKISESSEEFKIENRGHQSTCVSIIALAKTKELGIASWNSNTVDEIIRLGDEFYTGSIVQLKENGKLVDPNLALSEVGTEFKLESAVADFYCEESVVYGKLHENDGTFMSLATGLNVFFDDDDMGVIIASGISQAVLKYDNAYFLFDSHARDDLGRNLKTLDPISACEITGCACILRFTSIYDLATHFISNIEIGDSSTYTINKVEITLRSSNIPCLYHYKFFGKNSNAAILRAFESWHEDCENFKSEIEAKTLCNLFAALCFTKIVHPNQWNRMDINEILKIGYKLLCNVAKDPSAIWETLSSVEICGLQMKAEKSEPISGIFEPIVNILPEIDRANETVEEHVEIAEIERRESVRKSKASNLDLKADTVSKAPTVNPSTAAENEGDDSSIFPPINSEELRVPLLELLQSWNDQKEILSILTSSLFNLAIFKMNRVIFVFDPKASNEVGGLVLKRYEDFIKRFLQQEYEKLLEKLTVGGVVRRPSKEEELEELVFGRPVKFGALTIKPSQYVISMNNNDDDEEKLIVTKKGDAYVAWFTTPELAYEHILSKIPEKFRNQPFKLRNFIITTEIKEVQFSPWNDFTPVKEDHWIMRATFSQNDTQFPPTHRNNQDVPNCLMSMMFSKLCNSSDWNSTVLDVILKLGDRLFKKSLARQLAVSPVSASNLRLSLSQMEMPVFIRPFIINFTQNLVKKDMMVKLDDKTPLENFKKVIEKFLSSSDLGMLVTKKYYVAIWKGQEDGLMMFDPHDIGPDGTRKSTGFACLQRFMNHVNLVDTFWHNIKDLEGLNEFELIKISLIMDHYNGGVEEEFDNKLDVEHYSPASPCLPKTIHAKSTQLREDCVEMTICYAIATLCVSQSLDPEYYTADIIDRIILLGNELSHECMTNDEYCFMDFDLSKKSSCPDEINWNFQLNDTFASIQMDIFQRGVISKQPLPNLIFSLEEFFNFYSIGLLITCEFIAAMWKENENYFIFYACPIDDSGRRSKNMNAAPGFVTFKSVFELYNNIISNTLNQQSPFELRNCSILMSDVKGDEETCLQKPLKPCKSIVIPAVSKNKAKTSLLNIVQNSIEQNSEFKKQKKEMIESLQKCKRDGFLKYIFGGFICSQISKNSKTFDELSRKYHGPAICVMGAAMSALKEPNCWSPDIIDAIIISGNSLYIESSVLHRQKEIEITNIVPSLCIGGNRLSVKVEPCMEIECKDHLMALLDSIFKCRRCCYVLKKFDCWLLMKFGNLIFLFDPLGLNLPGKKKSNYHATLYRHDSYEKAVSQLIECIIESWGDKRENIKEENSLDETSTYEIGGIDVKILERAEKPKSKKETKKSERKKKFSHCSVKTLNC